MPEAAVAPPPAAAAPAAPAAAPSPAPGIVESAPKTSVDPFPGLSAELDDMIGKSGLGTQESEDRVARGTKPKPAPAKAAAPAKAPAPAKTASASKGADAPPEKPAETKPGEKPAETKPEEKPAETKPGEEAKPAEGKAGEHPAGEDKKNLGPWQRTHAAERRVKELEAELSKVRSAKPGDDPEKVELRTKYETAEKARKVLDEEMRFLNYERSSEFQEKHYKPYVETWRRAEAAIKDLKIPVEGGEPRAATIEDLSRIVQIGSNEEALERAEALFGTPAKAAFVMTLRNQLRESHHQMESAKAEWRGKGEERQRAWQAQQEQEQKANEERGKYYSDLWNQFNQSALEQHKDWFVAAEDDAEGAELLKRGFELADLAWNGSDKLEPEKLIALRSAERNKAAAFRYMVHLKAKADARIAELEKQIAEFEKSEPGGGVPAGEQKAQSDDIDAAIARIPRVG